MASYIFTTPPHCCVAYLLRVRRPVWMGSSAGTASSARHDPPNPRRYPPKYTLTGSSCPAAGAASRSFTSTAVNVTTQNRRQMVRVERTPKAKAYLRLHTTLGDLNLELHCDIAPRACENFLVLLESGYYSDTKFHRCIRNFMIQVCAGALSKRGLQVLVVLVAGGLRGCAGL